MKTEANQMLRDILAGGVDVHRCAAARTLGVMADPESVTALTKSLLDEDPDVRTDAAEALGKLGDPSAIPALMENLVDDPDPDVKKMALEALLRLENHEMVPLLRKLAVSRTEDVRWDDNEFFAEEWDTWLDLQIMAIQGLARFGADESAGDILTAMADEFGQDVTEIGVKALASLGQKGAIALEQLYLSGDARMHRRIAAALVAGNNSHAGDLLVRMLGDESASVRKVALTGLDPADERLEPLFEDPAAAVRAAVVRHSGPAFARKVRALIPDEDAEVRAEVFKVIAAAPDLFADETLAEDLQKAIAGEPEAAKQAALALVAVKGPDSAKGLAHVMTNKNIPLAFRVGVIEAFKKAGQGAVPYLLDAAGADERELRLKSLAALADFAANSPNWPNAAGDGLLAALKGELIPEPDPAEQQEEDPETAELELPPETPEKIAKEEQEIDESLPMVPEAGEGETLDVPEGSTLASILQPKDDTAGDVALPEPEFTPEQEALLEKTRRRPKFRKRVALDPDIPAYTDIQRYAATLLGNVVNAEVTEILIDILDSEDDELVTSALTGLAEHGEQRGSLPAEARAPLLDIIENAKGATRVLAVRALGWVDAPEVDDDLHRLLRDPEDFVRVEVVRAFDHRDVADDAVMAALKDSYLGVAVAAAASLARLRGEEAVDALVDFALDHDGSYRRDVGKLLGLYAPEAGVKRLIGVLKDESLKRSWLVAIDALAELFQYKDTLEERKVA